MADPITWRNVDAPNFSGSLAALQQSGQSLTQALSGLSAGLGQFDTNP